jgi:hypothetical protein
MTANRLTISRRIVGKILLLVAMNQVDSSIPLLKV